MPTYAAAEVAALNKKIQAASAAVLKEAGYEIVATKYIHGNACKVALELKRAGNAGADDERKDFEKNAHLFKLKPEMYGWVVTVQGKRLALLGFNYRKQKMPVMAREVDTQNIYYISERAASLAQPAGPMVRERLPD